MILAVSVFGVIGAVILIVSVVASAVAAIGFTRDWRRPTDTTTFPPEALSLRTGGRVGVVNATWPLVRVQLTRDAVRVSVPLTRSRVYRRGELTHAQVRTRRHSTGPSISFEGAGSGRPDVEVYGTPKLVSALLDLGWLNQSA
jgi:hypothetical protein